MKQYFEYPKTCPACGTDTEIDGKFLICPNLNCSGLELGNLNKWIYSLDIKDIGGKIISALYDAGKIKDVSDFYKLEIDDIASLERMGERSASKMLKHLHERMELTLPEFLGSLNMENVSTRTIEAIVEAGYETLDKILAISSEELIEIQGIEEKTANMILSGLESKKELIDKLLEVGIKIKKIEKKQATSDKLLGKSFCFTGAITKTDENGKRLSRDDIHNLVIENNGKVESSVKKGLDYLVMADPNSTSSKAQKARKLGTKILSEADFFKMLG